MATRTFTSTKAYTSMDRSVTTSKTGNTALDKKSGRDSHAMYSSNNTRVSQEYDSTMVLSLSEDGDSSASASDDDSRDDGFGADVIADIQADLKYKEEIKANGGKKPRRKKKMSEVQKQNLQTRKAVMKGQDREAKTAKWARRERRLNPLIALLDIELEIVPSDEDSSEGSIDSDKAGNLSETSRAIFQRSKRRKRAALAAEKTKRKLANTADRSKPYTGNEDHSHSKTPDRRDTDQTDKSAKRRSKVSTRILTAQSQHGINTVTPILESSDTEGSISEDISPMDVVLYQAQLARRAARALTKQKLSTSRPHSQASPPSLARTRGQPGNGSSSSESDEMPDVPPDNAKYLAWLQRKKDKNRLPSKTPPSGSGRTRTLTSPASDSKTFRAYIQTESRPHLEVHSVEQANIQGHLLGRDEQGRRVQIPAAINRFLRAYQREGVEFFWTHFRRSEGGLLGDDMGLGKTIQVISFLCSIMHHSCSPTEENRRRDLLGGSKASQFQSPLDLGPTALIICPASVVDNWARELDTWTYLSAAVYRPQAEKIHRVLKEFRSGKLDIVICGMEAARTHIDEISGLPWSCIFIDEVHKVKNPLSETSLAFHKFESKVRFGLTGTAMQNRYGELHTVLDWCFPGRLGDRSQWRDYVETPLKDAQKKDATQKQLATGRTRAIALVKYLLPNFFLRRTKDLIADQLPKKSDQIVFCPLSPQQVKAYKRLLSHHEVQTILTHDEPCPCGRTDEAGLPFAKGKCCYRDWSDLTLKWITVFSKVANHAVLIYPNKVDKIHQPEKFAQDQETTRFAFPDTYANHRDGELYASSRADLDRNLCGKWPVLNNLLEAWYDKGDKVLLFSRSTRLLDALQHWVELVPFNLVRLDGSVPPEKRLALCDKFNDPKGDVFIFLISTLAGGVGLNLTAANKVVIFDPNWNPVADLQAMDRSYRWGQTRDVHVYRLVGSGSIEELIYTRQIYKQQQAEIAYDAANPSRMFVGVQDDKDNQGELFGVKNLFRFNETSNRTKHSIEQAQISELSFALLNSGSSRLKKRKRVESDVHDELCDDEQTEEGLSSNSQAVLDALVGEKPLPQANDEEDAIAVILKNSGVLYTHSHTNLVKHSVIEERITKAAIKNFRDASTRGRASNLEASNAEGRVKLKQAAEGTQQEQRQERCRPPHWHTPSQKSV